MQESQTLAIIMEYADGGDIAKQITQRKSKNQRFSEQEIW